MSKEEPEDNVAQLSEADKKIIVQALKDLGVVITGLEGLSDDLEEDGEVDDAKNKLEEVQELLQSVIGGEEAA